MTSPVSRALHAEHGELMSALEALRTVARDLDDWDPVETPARLAALVAVLRDDLGPHAGVEERVLYPAYERVLHRPGSTATMVADHDDIRRRTEVLAAEVHRVGASALPPSAQERGALQEQLFGLRAILDLHFEKEERVILPGLDEHLSAAEAAAMLRELGLHLPFPENLDPWEAKVYEHVTGHLANEAFALEGYQHLADLLASTYVGYLLRLVIDDERHHHRLFGDLVRTLQSRGGDEADRDATVVPRVEPLPDTTELLTAVERYLTFERGDRRELERLAVELRPVRDTSIWPLLVETMQRDTDKHIRILEFIAEQAPRALEARAARGTVTGAAAPRGSARRAR